MDADTKLYAEERRQLIMQLLREAGRVEVIRLAERFTVTPETIRQDLNSLQRSGLIKRIHGGAVPLERLGYEARISERTEFSEEKERIAQGAVDLLPTSGSVFLESGSTSTFLAERFPVGRELTVFTNSLPIATLLTQRSELTVITLGGRVRPVTLGEVGHMAIRSMQEINVDVAFLGTNGLSAQQGLTTPDQAEADFKQATLQVAKTTVLLADHSKFGQVSLWKYGDLAAIDILVTGASTDEALLAGVRDAVGDVVQAQ